MKCPKCHEGDLFKTKNPYDLSNYANMYERCTKCNQKYSPEPNFFYGAMYVSYGYSVAIFIAVYVFTLLFLDLKVWQTISLVGLILVVLAPIVFRLSRSTYVGMFIKYNKDAAKKLNR